ncbi:hypothetical protein SNOG_03697 [Parastagonospora nodorum SN15]|uniref:Ribosome biogenesis regulatory protein n=1 Tax=Phaeosphaeria nodorum (strain SN15 / ATCC MYA-4574 / FGSC 10173) TaxID=321614 RepID=Q0UX17_PHANO|nr:hypothetical protein SNOG_03697 [Parastagonospora nodorum SN15]EAT88902.2 hypothetical protein SNOG_03697 [Parastagonospora nodorum SN15]
MERQVTYAEWSRIDRRLDRFPVDCKNNKLQISAHTNIPQAHYRRKAHSLSHSTSATCSPQQSPNPVPADADEEVLRSTARDAAQALVNQLLSTCQIKSSAEGVHLVLPSPSTPLPREKPIPAVKEATKWERFAAKKGIKDKKRDGKLVYDDASGEWVPKWGYKGKNKDGENDWLVEVDESKEAKTGEAHDARADSRRERKDRMKRNERKQRNNDRAGRKNGAA